MRILACLLACSLAPVGLYADINGLPVGYAGVPSGLAVDNGGETCVQCHTGLPVVTGGTAFTIDVSSYTPGVPQTIPVKVIDNRGLRFGFQLTARLASDLTQEAGTFSPTPSSQVWCANGQAGPCSGIQYATNTTSAAIPSPQGADTFAVTWIPPGRDVGSVAFYAAAVSANGDGTDAGDQVYAIAGQRVDAGSCDLTGTPTFNTGTPAVVDSASYRTISTNGLITILGTNLAFPGAPAYRATQIDLVNGDWPTDLACVSVEVTVPPATTPTPIPLWYVSQQQINAQAPSIPTGELVQVQVVLNPATPSNLNPSNTITSSAYYAAAAPVAPALFTFNSQGTGNAAALDGSQGSAYLAAPSVVASGVSAAPGDIILLYGTGFGDTTPSYLPGVFATGLTQLVNPISVTIGGVTVTSPVCGSCDIQYAGLSFDAPGLYQVNVRVPDVPDNPETPVSVTVGTSVTQGGVWIPVKR
jgi:uncharacterized protein (TIGR03437 family)